MTTATPGPTEGLAPGPAPAIWVFLRAGGGRIGGGRLHGWLMACALKRAGFRVTVVSDRPPGFAADLPGGTPRRHGDANPRMLLHPGLVPPPAGAGEPAWVVVVPGGNADPPLYRSALNAARAADARVCLLDFETPRWMESLLGGGVEPERWASAVLVADHADLILSATAEGSGWARDFYGGNPSRFSCAAPCVNEEAARAALEADGPAEAAPLVCVTRFGGGDTHKGGGNLPLFCGSELAGRELALVVGRGGVPAAAVQALDEATRRAGMRWSLHEGIDELEKFRLLRRAGVLVAPSRFEGFGYPAVEALCVGTPVVAYDLPVVREATDGLAVTSAAGDPVALRRAAAGLLERRVRVPEAVSRVFLERHTVDAFGQRLRRALDHAGRGVPRIREWDGRGIPGEADRERQAVLGRKSDARVRAPGPVPVRLRSAGGRPIRVLFVSHAADHSGAPISLSILLRHFRATTDWEPVVLLKKDGPNRGIFEALAPTVAFGPGAGHRAAARSEVERFAPDLVYSNTAMNGDVLADLEAAGCLRPDVPVLVHVRDRLGLSMLRGSGREHFLGRSGRLLAVSRAVERELELRFGFEPSRIGPGPVCLDVAATRAAAGAEGRDAVRAALGVPAGGLLVGNAGLLIPRKGPDLFVAAAAELVRRHPEPGRLRFVWVGGGPEREAAEGLAEEAGLSGSLRFLGLRENPQPVLRALDLLLMTSRDDPFPRVVLEAGLHAVPSVAWEAAGGACEFIEPPGLDAAGAVAGRGAEALDPVALAGAALPLLTDPAARAAAGAAAQRRAEAFDVAAVGPVVVAEVERFVGSARSPEPQPPPELEPLPPEPAVAVLLLAGGDPAADGRSSASIEAQTREPDSVHTLAPGEDPWPALVAAGPAGVDLVAPLRGGDAWDPDRLERLLAFAAATPTAAAWTHPLRGGGGGGADAGDPPLGRAGDPWPGWREAGRVPAAAGWTTPLSGLLLRRAALEGNSLPVGLDAASLPPVLLPLAALAGPVARHPEALGEAEFPAAPDPAAWLPALNQALADRGEAVRFCLDPAADRVGARLPDAADAWRSRRGPAPPSSPRPAAARPLSRRLRPTKHNAVRLLHRLGLEAAARSLLGRPGPGGPGGAG